MGGLQLTGRLLAACLLGAGGLERVAGWGAFPPPGAPARLRSGLGPGMRPWLRASAQECERRVRRAPWAHQPSSPPVRPERGVGRRPNVRIWGEKRE